MIDNQASPIDPVEDGFYAAEIYTGWKLLHFFEGRWWHFPNTALWTAGVPKQWVGPLPELIGGKPLPKATQVFDL